MNKSIGNTHLAAYHGVEVPEAEEAEAEGCLESKSVTTA